MIGRVGLGRDLSTHVLFPAFQRYFFFFNEHMMLIRESPSSVTFQDVDHISILIFTSHIAKPTLLI